MIAGLLTNFADLEIVQNAFNGVRACVCVLILNAVLKLFKTDVVDLATFLIFLAVLAGAALPTCPPVLFVVVAGALGIVLRALVWTALPERRL